MSTVFADSDLTYMRHRRLRQLDGYGYSAANYTGVAVGAEEAASLSEGVASSATRVIAVGVATGVLTFLVNRILERWLP